jgi:FkbM family methyltransferase
LIDWLGHMEDFKIPRKGVIHIGIHKGKEIDAYKNAGFEKILVVDANPELAMDLVQRYKSDPKVIVQNCAILDKIKVVDFFIASGDSQASSILRMKDHKIYYPSIHESEKITVAGLTLDYLLLKLNLSPTEFNFLNIDIQGAELLALKGASGLLPFIDIINCEVNKEELYEGGAKFDEIESYLSAFGINRLAEAYPFHHSWGDALYVKAPVITMSTLGNNGRLANQFFQYLFLKILQSEQRVVLQTPPWSGQNIFEIDDPLLLGRKITKVVEKMLLPKGVEFLGIDPERFIQTSPMIFSDIDFYGYFQIHTKVLSKYKSLALRTFKFTEDWEKRFKNILKGLNPDGRPIVALHLRRGDYGYKHFFIAPWTWYHDALSDINEHNFYILVSEDPVPYVGRFKGFDVATSLGCGLDESERALFDFWILTQADRVMISNSSFSFFACLLNTTAVSFLRPSVKEWALVEFDPWDSHVLDREPLSDEKHRELIDMDSLNDK